MSESVTFRIKVDGLDVVIGGGCIDNALHYFQQYMRDGKKVTLTITVLNDEEVQHDTL